MQPAQWSSKYEIWKQASYSYPKKHPGCTMPVYEISLPRELHKTSCCTLFCSLNRFTSMMNKCLKHSGISKLLQTRLIIPRWVPLFDSFRVQDLSTNSCCTGKRCIRFDENGTLNIHIFSTISPLDFHVWDHNWSLTSHKVIHYLIRSSCP